MPYRHRLGYMAIGPRRPRRLLGKRGRAAVVIQRYVRRRKTGYYRAQRNMRTAGFMGAELKFFDSSRAAIALTAPTDATGGEVDPVTLNCLFAPTQGTGVQSRDGRRVVMKSLQIRGVVTVPNADVVTTGKIAPVFFIAIVMDKQTNAAQASSEDVFTNPGAAALLAASPLRDLERSTRFRVLKEWILTGDTPTTVDGSTDQNGYSIPFGYYGKMSTKVEFVANGGSVADIQDISLHVMAYCSSTTFAPTITYNSRVRFMG